MEKLKQLKHELNGLLDEQKSLNNLALIEERDFTDAEKREYAKLDTKAKELHSAIRARDAELDKIVGSPPPPTPEQKYGVDSRGNVLYPDGYNEDLRGKERVIAPGERRSYVDLWGPQAGSGTASFDERCTWWQEAISGLSSPQMLAAKRAASELVDSDGGFMLTPTIGAPIYDRIHPMSVALTYANLFPTKSKIAEIPMVLDTTHATGTVAGGVKAYRTAELATITESNAKFGKLLMTMYKLAALSQASNELVNDVQRFVPIMEETYAEAMAFAIDEELVNGTGAGQMLGIMNAGSLITQDKETSQAANTFVWENAVNMWARLLDSSRTNAVWLMNSTLIPKLHGMTVSVGTGGAYIPAVTKGVNGYELLTRPIIFTEHCSQLGTAGDVILADLSKYIVALRQELVVDFSQHAGFTNDSIYLRAIMRCNGQPLQSTVFTPRNGSTQSPFIALETRS